MAATGRDRFLALLRDAVGQHALTKLTLGKPHGGDPTLRNLFVRPVALKAGPQFSFVYRHATRDITKNHPPAAALAELEPLIGRTFLDAHLFTSGRQAQLECQPDGTSRLRAKSTDAAPAAASKNSPAHDRARQHAVAANAPWLRALGVTNDNGQPRADMAPKFRQIQKFTELISHLTAEAALPADRAWEVADMGCGKGYLTFAVAALLGDRARVRGLERRADLVDLDNQVARQCGCTNLTFAVGEIVAGATGPLDLLVALHACDTATDDALAQGIAAGARLLVVSPCCQKELRPQLTAPPVLAPALQHGIFQARQAEFVTDALRALLLEWAGYRTKVFEFISTEHTAKNIMIVAIRDHAPGDPGRAEQAREFARFYGIRTQRLAAHLAFPLQP